MCVNKFVDDLITSLDFVFIEGVPFIKIYLSPILDLLSYCGGHFGFHGMSYELHCLLGFSIFCFNTLKFLPS